MTDRQPAQPAAFERDDVQARAARRLDVVRRVPQHHRVLGSTACRLQGRVDDVGIGFRVRRIVRGRSLRDEILDAGALEQRVQFFGLGGARDRDA